MARVTVDDCMKRIDNRFQMTLAATYRARQLASGATPMVEVDKDKPTVIRKADIEEQKKSDISLMPMGLLNKLSREEILDLIAFVYARGDKKDKLFGEHHH